MLGFYIYYLYKYPRPHDINYLSKYYPKDLILRTGGKLYSPKIRFQHFLNFPPSKKQGIIRIGTFGDSNTFGDEVDKTESYPYQLQKLFDQKLPNKKIEVLNFGKGGAGFQEQFFLWEKYAKSYGLDYILLGPRGFWPNRDVTFSKNWWLEFSHPRARFILSDNKLKQVHIKGKTLKERYKNYYTLIPSWTALRYDIKPFQIWEMFLPFLRYKIHNFFYYKSMSNEKEATKINMILLEKMRNLHNKKILFFTYYKPTFYNYQKIKNLYNLNSIPFQKNRLYRRFAHKSSLGNELVAKIYFNTLIGKKEFSLKAINCYFKKSTTVWKDKILTAKSKRFKQNSVNSTNKKFDKDLFAVQSIQVTDGNITILTLRHNISNHYHKKGSYLNHKIKGTKSFIAFFNKYDFLESAFIPSHIQLKKDMNVYIQLANKNRIKLGSIKPLDIYEKFFVFYEQYIKSNIDTGYTHHYSHFILEKMPFILKDKIKPVKKSVKLFIEDYKIGHLELYNLYGKNSLRLIPVNGYEKSFLMMGPSRGYVRKHKFPDEFPLYIQYNMNNGESFKSLIPDWRCKKRKQKILLKLPNFDPLN